MKTITVKFHDRQDAALARAAEAAQTTKSEIIRRSVEIYLEQNKAPAPRGRKGPTALDLLKKYIPKRGTGVRDLSA